MNNKKIETVISFNNADIFHGDHLVLTNVSFSVNTGEFVYLIGKVGSGKTSLVKTMNAEIPLRHGEANVVGFALQSLKKSQIPYLYRTCGAGWALFFRIFSYLPTAVCMITCFSYFKPPVGKRKTIPTSV